MKVFFLPASLAFVLASGGAQANPAPPASQGTGITQNNQTSLSQNMRGRTSTATQTSSVASPIGAGSEVARPVNPTPLVIGSQMPPAPLPAGAATAAPAPQAAPPVDGSSSNGQAQSPAR